MDTSRRAGYLGLVLLSGIAMLILYAAAGHAIVADVYYQRSLPALNGMIGHADQHPVAFYLKKADDLLLYLAMLWLGATVAYWLARRRLRKRTGASSRRPRRLERQPDLGRRHR